MSKVVFTLVFCSILSFHFTYGQRTIAAWDFSGNVGDEITVMSDYQSNDLSTLAPSLEISRGAGIIARSNADSFNARAWCEPDINSAVANQDYFEWTITPENGLQMDLIYINLNLRRSATGPPNFSLKCSIDGFNTDVWNVNNIAVGNTQHTIFLDEFIFSSLQGALTFRLYGYGNNVGDVNGTAGLSGSGNDIVINGIIYPVGGAISYDWTGAGGNNDFENPNNWDPARNSSYDSDILQFSDGGEHNVLVGTAFLGGLRITNNTSVTFTANADSRLSLLHMSFDPEVVLVESGSSLIIDSNSAIEIYIESDSEATIAGHFLVQNTNNGVDRSHRLLAESENSIVFDSGSVCEVLDLNGSLFGDTGISETVVFQSGASYLAKGGGNPFGLSSPSSKVVFQSGSTYSHQHSGVPSFAGRNYPNFEFDYNGVCNINVFGSNNPVIVDNLRIIQGTFTISVERPVEISGDLSVNNGSTFNFIPDVSSDLVFNGASLQHISGEGNITLGSNSNLILNNVSNLLIERNLVIDGGLTFSAGKILLPELYTLTFSLTATDDMVDNGNALSYVEGKVRKEFNSDAVFTFPIGGSDNWCPVTITTAEGSILTQFEASYYKIPYSGGYDNLLEGIAHISRDRYWLIDRIAGDRNASIRLQWTNDIGVSTDVNEREDLRVAHFNGSDWEIAGDNNVHTVDGDHNVGGVSSGVIDSFSPFTIASITALNPLATEYIQLFSERSASDLLLTWNCHGGTKLSDFTLERSYDGENYTQVAQVSTTYFQFPLPNTTSYFRIRTNSESKNNDIISNVVKIERPGSEQFLIYPNAVNQYLNIHFENASDEKTRVNIINIKGQEMVNKEFTDHSFHLDLSDLQKGIYVINLYTRDKVLTKKFIKN